MKRFPLLLILLIAAATVWTWGCGDDDDDSRITTPEGSSGWFGVLLTDAPSDYIDTAMVTISRVYLLPDSSDTTGPVELMPEGAPPETFNLLELRDGIEAFLAQIEVEPGFYQQLRMVVDSAWVSLVDSILFDDGTNSQTLKVPSGMSSGIKVQLDRDVEVEEGMTTLVVVDFDVDDNFKFQGNPDTPAGIKGVTFTPVLKEKGRRTQDGEAEPED